MNIALLSTDKLPAFLGENHPMEDSLFAEDLLLIRELNQSGNIAQRVAWRQPDHPWQQYDRVIIRSTWDYIDHLPQFLATLEQIQSRNVRLINPYATVAWNYDKRYLGQLSAAGLPVVPTHFFSQADYHAGKIEHILAQYKTIVAKPVLGVGAFGVKIISSRSDLDQISLMSERHGTIMIQPFLISVQSEGEWSFIFGAGNFLYAVLKTPAAGDFRVQVMYGAQTKQMNPVKMDLQAARAVCAALPVEASIARIDMVRLNDGNLALMEAELIEPQLYFHDVPDAARLLANAILSA